MNLSEEGKCLLAATNFEATNSVFIITYENNSFSTSIPGRWRVPNYLEDGIIDKLKNLLKLGSQNDIEILHVEEVRKKGDKIKLNSKQFSLTDFDTARREILEVLKSASYHDLEDLVYRRGLTYDGVIDVLDIKYFPSESKGCTVMVGIYEITDVNRTLEYFLPDIVKVIITIDDIRLRSILNIDQILIFTEKSFFIQLWDKFNLIQVLWTILKFSFNWYMVNMKAKSPLVLQVLIKFI